jgi:hypothetical protein
MAQVVYNRFKQRVVTGQIDLDSANIRCLILETTAAGAFNPDIDTVSALLAVGGVTEATGTGAGRRTATLTVTEDDTNDRANVALASAVTWTGANWGDAVAVVFYDEGSGTDATRQLIAYYDTGLPITTNGGDLTINTGDILRVA